MFSKTFSRHVHAFNKLSSTFNTFFLTLKIPVIPDVYIYMWICITHKCIVLSGFSDKSFGGFPLFL